METKHIKLNAEGDMEKMEDIKLDEVDEQIKKEWIEAMEIDRQKEEPSPEAPINNNED